MTQRAQTWVLELRDRLASPPPGRLGDGPGRAAAVLVPLYVDKGQLWTVLTRRSDELPQHRGQIAFPGGALEAGEDSWEAALRESHEEIGLETAAVLRIGELDEMETPTGFRIVPCVGAVPVGMSLDANPSEIAEVFTVPLLAFTDPAVIEEKPIRVNGEERHVRFYNVGERPVWGLTARILQNLLVRVGLEPPDGP